VIFLNVLAKLISITIRLQIFQRNNNPPQKILPKGEEDEALASACACSKVGSRI
jgi:hypothetical protein